MLSPCPALLFTPVSSQLCEEPPSSDIDVGLQAPPQTRWTRQVGQSGHQGRLRYPLVFRAAGHSGPPAPRAPVPLVYLTGPGSAAPTQCNLLFIPTPSGTISCHQSRVASSLGSQSSGVITWVTSQTCFSFIWKMGRMHFPSRLQSRYSLTICRLGIHPLSLPSPPPQGPLPGCVGPRIPPRGICVQPVWEGPGRGRFL